MNRSRVLLLLFVLLLAALWYAWQETPRQQKISTKKNVTNGTNVAAVNRGTKAGTATLDFSGGEALTFNKPQRDLFRPLYRAPVVVNKPVVSPKPEPIVVKPPPPPPPPQPRPVVAPLVGDKPIPPLDVLGFLQNGARTTVFLASRQGDLYLVKKGDRFAEGLLVRELDKTKIVISRGLNDTGVTLAVSEPKSLRMAIPNLPSGRPAVPEYKDPEPPTENPAADVEEINQ